MAQPQGLNVPAIITTGVVTALLTGIIVEGVRALYNYEEHAENDRKFVDVDRVNTVHELRDQQLNRIKFQSNVPIDQAMKKVVESGGKMPSTRPNS